LLRGGEHGDSGFQEGDQGVNGGGEKGEEGGTNGAPEIGLVVGRLSFESFVDLVEPVSLFAGRIALNAWVVRRNYR